MTNFQIQTFTGSVQNQSVQLINARELHESLKVKTKFQDWINRRLLNGYFRKDVDFLNVLRFENVKTGLLGSREMEIKDYHLTLDTAKHLCLMENSEIGYQIRQQFIDNDNKARAELARLMLRLIGIPTFLRNNPYELARLITTARTAFLTANPQAKDFLRYREMGLSYREIGTLLGKTKDSVKWMAFKMRNLGFFSSTLPKTTAVQLDLLA